MDLYEILGLTIDCSYEDILKAFEIKTITYHESNLNNFISVYVAGKLLLDNSFRNDYNLVYFLRDERVIYNFLENKKELIECLITEATSYYNLPIIKLMCSFSDRGLIYLKYKGREKYAFIFKPFCKIYQIIIKPVFTLIIMSVVSIINAWFILIPLLLIIILIKLCN